MSTTRQCFELMLSVIASPMYVARGQSLEKSSTIFGIWASYSYIFHIPTYISNIFNIPVYSVF